MVFIPIVGIAWYICLFDELIQADYVTSNSQSGELTVSTKHMHVQSNLPTSLTSVAGFVWHWA